MVILTPKQTGNRYCTKYTEIIQELQALTYVLLFL